MKNTHYMDCCNDKKIGVVDLLNGEIFNELDPDKKIKMLLNEIYKLGSWDEIEKKAKEEVLLLLVSTQIIAAWQWWGWMYIIDEHQGYMPYVSKMLAQLGLKEHKRVFDQIVSVVPDFFMDCDEETYLEITAYLFNPKIEVEDERLKKIPLDEGEKMNHEYWNLVCELDALCKTTWDRSAPEKGWKQVLDYINQFQDVEQEGHVEYLQLFMEYESDDVPVVYFYEVNLDDERFALRAMEVFSNGRVNRIEDLYCDTIEAIPIPTVEEFNTKVWGEEFYAYTISKGKFDKIWNSGVYSGSLSKGEVIS